MNHQYKRSSNNPGAVINTDKTALDAYKQRKAQFEKINKLEERMNNIEDLLIKILEKFNKEN